MNAGDLVSAAAGLSLGVHLALLGACLFKVVWRGENIVDRLMGADLIATLSLAVLVLVAILSQDAIYIDVALGLAALGFVSTLALARFLADERMF